jgi:hypothetical protein
MMADNAHPMAAEIYAALPPGLVVVDDARGRQPSMGGSER